MPLINFLRGRAVRRVIDLGSLTPIGRVQLLFRFPSVARLSLRLFTDPRVPLAAKVATMGVIAAVLSPFDIPGWVPVIGQFGDALVIVNVLDIFIKAAPRAVVEEHIRALGLEGSFKI